MLRTTIVGLIATVLLGTGLTAATAGDPDLGKVWRDRNGVLKEGCATYRVQYRVTPPTPDWSLELFLVDRRGETVAHQGATWNYDPKRGTKKLRLCEYNTVPGRFKLRGKLTYDGNMKSRWVEPDRFRLRKDVG